MADLRDAVVVLRLQHNDVDGGAQHMSTGRIWMG